MLDVLGQIFWFGILITPLIGFLIVRKLNISIGSKFLLGILITVSLGAIFYVIAMAIVLRNGLGPT